MVRSRLARLAWWGVSHRRRARLAALLSRCIVRMANRLAALEMQNAGAGTGTVSSRGAISRLWHRTESCVGMSSASVATDVISYYGIPSQHKSTIFLLRYYKKTKNILFIPSKCLRVDSNGN